jgi:hypothetical protein
MGWSIVAGVIHMDESSVDDWHALQEVSQYFTQVVAILERHVRRQYDIRFHEQLVARMIRPQVLDLADRGGEAHCEIQQQVTLIWLGREASQVTDMVGRCLAPVEDDNKRQQQTAKCVEPPNTSVEPHFKSVSVVPGSGRQTNAYRWGTESNRH